MCGGSSRRSIVSWKRPRVYDGVELTIPVGMKIGLNLGEMVEFEAADEEGSQTSLGATA